MSSLVNIFKVRVHIWYLLNMMLYLCFLLFQSLYKRLYYVIGVSEHKCCVVIVMIELAF